MRQNSTISWAGTTPQEACIVQNIATGLHSHYDPIQVLCFFTLSSFKSQRFSAFSVNTLSTFLYSLAKTIHIQSWLHPLRNYTSTMGDEHESCWYICAAQNRPTARTKVGRPLTRVTQLACNVHCSKDPPNNRRWLSDQLRP